MHLLAIILAENKGRIQYTHGIAMHAPLSFLYV